MLLQEFFGDYGSFFLPPIYTVVAIAWDVSPTGNILYYYVSGTSKTQGDSMKIEANLPAEVETRAIRLKETLGCTYSQLVIQGINKLAMEYLVFHNATNLKDHGGDRYVEYPAGSILNKTSNEE